MDRGTGPALAQPLVGREQQLALLGGVFAGAAAGRPTVVLIQGEAGMGKSALLARSAAEFEAGGAVLLRAAGDEAESALPLGVLGQLVAGISPRPALLAGLGPSAELDPLTAGAGLLELLGELQDRGPVVLVVDDAHWADSASLHALAFCLRRLRADQVLTLLAARAEEAHRLPRGLAVLAQHPAGMTVSLPGLDGRQLAELARALGAGVLSPRTADRLARHTAGSPLLASALLQELGAARLSTPGGLEAHAPRSFSSIVLARLAGCAPRGRELAMAGAVLGLRWPLALAAELAGVDDLLAAADEGAEAGLIVIEHRSGGMPLGGFPHPLVQAALYREITLSRRAALHRAAAGLVEDPRDALRHKMEAAIGPNPGLAAELASTAGRDAAGGWWATAARTYLWAARVAPGRAQRERHVLDAAVCLLLAGDVAEARALVSQAAPFADAARLHLARGYLAWTDGTFGPAEDELRAAWGLAAGPGDREAAARAAYLLSSLCVYLGRGDEGIAWARRSLEAHPGHLPGISRWTSLLVGYGISGRADDGLAEAARLELDRVDARHADGLVGRGTLRLWADDPAGAREDLLPAAEACLRHGPLESGMFAAVHLADAEWRLGLWDDALLHAEAGVNAAEQTLHGWFIAEAHAVAALPLITRGDWEAAQAHLREAVDAARKVGYGHGSLWAIVARARLADARGDPERVVRTLTPLLGYAAADGVDHPGIHSWRELLGAAMITLGQSAEAGEQATALEHQAQRLGLRSAHARALRLRGLIEAAAGRHQTAIGSFESALDELKPLQQPFDRALAEADLGASLRRAGRRRAAADRLRQAEAALTRLGATPYLERVRQELSACGLHPARETMPAGERLTPAELAVARLVASGKSNREVASELVLSAKTIEHHLGRIYHKLGIGSRTQLTVRLAQRSSEPPQPVTRR
jgi:DNA-binding CsgD family transcriptional regulator